MNPIAALQRTGPELQTIRGAVVSTARQMDTDTETREAADAAGALADCLVRVARRRDRQAFRVLFDHFAPLIRAFAYRVRSLEHPDQFADDLVQESMLKVWLRAEAFDPARASPSTWIFAIVRNMRIDLLRRRARHIVNTVSLRGPEDDGELDLEDIWFEDTESDVFDQLARQRSRRMVQESLSALPPEQAFVLNKVYMEDKSHAEVAAELQLPLGTVKTRVRLALNKLKLLVDR